MIFLNTIVIFFYLDIKYPDILLSIFLLINISNIILCSKSLLSFLYSNLFSSNNTDNRNY